MQKILPAGFQDCLLWAPELDMAWHPKQPMEYNHDYFQKYQQMDASQMGAELTRLRIQLVRRHFQGDFLVDVGIGGGRFCTEANVYGFDVNPSAVEWLRAQGRYYDPYRGIHAVSCWDSLEHIPEPEKLLERVKKWLFVSLPIFAGQKDCLSSKHYKPGEHIWYFTQQGFISWCHRQGFALVEWNCLEVKVGREGIYSFAFKRME